MALPTVEDTFPQGKAEMGETVVSQGAAEGMERRETAGLRLPETAREESETIANPALRLPEQRQENRQTGENGLRIRSEENTREVMRNESEAQTAEALKTPGRRRPYTSGARRPGTTKSGPSQKGCGRAAPSPCLSLGF